VVVGLLAVCVMAHPCGFQPLSTAGILTMRRPLLFLFYHSIFVGQKRLLGERTTQKGRINTENNKTLI